MSKKKKKKIEDRPTDPSPPSPHILDEESVWPAPAIPFVVWEGDVFDHRAQADAHVRIVRVAATYPVSMGPQSCGAGEASICVEERHIDAAGGESWRDPLAGVAVSGLVAAVLELTEAIP